MALASHRLLSFTTSRRCCVYDVGVTDLSLSLILVIWAVVDVAPRPVREMPAPKKALWIIGSIPGWLFYFGLFGAVVAVFYLAGPRRRNEGRTGNI